MRRRDGTALKTRRRRTVQRGSMTSLVRGGAVRLLLLLVRVWGHGRCKLLRSWGRGSIRIVGIVLLPMAQGVELGIVGHGCSLWVAELDV